MMSRMRCWLGMVLLSCAPVMAGEWIQKGVDSFSTGLFWGTEIDSLGQVSLASFRGVNLALDAVASSGPNTYLAGRRVLWDGQPAAAGRKRLAWDGRDESGRLVAPGHYLLRVEIDADRGDVWTGLVGVVY